MFRNLVIIAIIPIVAALGYMAVTESLLPPADFSFELGDSLHSLDPANMSWKTEGLIAAALWEGLAAYHPETTAPIPGVAYLPPQISDDGLTYTFELRRQARWSNNDPVRPEDFIYAWRRAIEPGTAGLYVYLIRDNIAGAKAYSDWRHEAVRVLTLLRDLQKGMILSEEDRQFLGGQGLPDWDEPTPDYSQITAEFRQGHVAEMEERFTQVGLQALDDHHLQVTLVRPIGYFLDLVAFATYLPLHRSSLELLREQDHELTLWVYDPQWVKPDYHKNGYPGAISNGPFSLVDWQFKRYMYFEKNPHYWDRENVKSARIVARILTEPSTAFLAYEHGDVDFFRQLSRLDFAPALVDQARRKLRDDIHVVPAFGTYYYDFNCRPTLADGSANPFSDSRLRMAFNLAVDKQALSDNVKRTGNPVARNLVPPGTIPEYYCSPGPDYNVARAQKLLAEAGYPNGKGLPAVEILYNNGYGHEMVAQAIEEMWRKNLNVTVNLRGKEIKSFSEDRTKGQFMILRASWFGDYADPTTFLDLMITDNGNNHGKFSAPEYDRLMAEAADCLDPRKRMDLLAQAEHLLMQEQMPILPLYYYVNVLGFGKEVKGIYPNAQDEYPLKHIYVEK